jgi:predicted alpha/beta hydrolase family esterase
VVQVVLVAHSMGGLTQLLLMERFSSKIGLAISVAAVLTASELSVFDDATFADLVNTLELCLVTSQASGVAILPYHLVMGRKSY